jgi:hypothetical protein
MDREERETVYRCVCKELCHFISLSIIIDSGGRSLRAVAGGRDMTIAQITGSAKTMSTNG